MLCQGGDNIVFHLLYSRLYILQLSYLGLLGLERADKSYWGTTYGHGTLRQPPAHDCGITAQGSEQRV